MTRRIATFLPILIIATLFLGFGLIWVAMAQGGPHGNYSAMTDACAGCHRSHTGLGSRLLSSSSYVNDFCYSCHDGSGAPSSPVVSTHGNTDFPERVEDSFQLSCTQCHDPHGSDNLYTIRESVVIRPLLDITTGPVVFTSTTGVNSYDDGVSDPASRICVTCHDNSDNPGYPMANHIGGANHLGGADYTGQDCTTCHRHDLDDEQNTLDGFMPADCTGCHGQPPDGTTYPNRDGSHSTHFAPTAFGPQFDLGVCSDCHFFSGTTHNDGQVTFADSQPLATTTACNGCHSPGGAFNGVDTTADSVGARDNWYTGVYTGSGPTITLQTGKEKWCAGCHDSGTSVVNGVSAPGVAGDVAQTYGYYVTGHGQNDMVLCAACHDAAMAHTDGLSRTYTAADDNYQAGYRLKSVNGQPPLAIPDFSGGGGARNRPGDYRLCFSCHDQYRVLGDLAPSSGDYYLSEWGTNFRDDQQNPQATRNDHDRHVSFGAQRWDSDGDGSTDANINCPACHNVHGPQRPTAMIRTGELIGRTTALNVVWLTNLEGEPYSFTYDLTSSTGVLMESNCDIQGGDVGCSNQGNVANSGVCTMCHQSVEDWYRDPINLDGCLLCHSGNVDDGDGNPPGGRRAIAGEFENASHHVQGPVQAGDCQVCHEIATHGDGYLELRNVDTSAVYREAAPGAYRPENITSADSQALAPFCLSCHDSDGANGDATPFSTEDRPVPVVDSTAWSASVHDTGGAFSSGYGCLGDGTTSGCHATAHGSANEKILSEPSVARPMEQLCYNCHTDGMVQNDALSNNRPGGYVSADDIEEAFGKSRRHDLGTVFTVGGDSFAIQCTSCHNPHVVTGKYWDAASGVSPITRPDFSDPVNNPRAMGSTLWGDEPGEKMDDFAAQASGTGGWYYNTARGYLLGATGLPWDQPAVYQPPKSGSGYEAEFGGDVLPDYTTLCLDCHSYRMSAANPPVNWGQGISCTDNSVDPPDQRIECGAQHGLGAAGMPQYVSDEGTAGFWGSSGNPDVIFDMSYVTRGRHNGHFMRWPYDSAERSAGINFVLSCTDCHEAHGSDRGGMIRERFNVNANGDCGAGGDPDPNGENCSDGGNWNSFCTACHYYYGGQHTGMSCGNASCHEANSIHRIIHTLDSGAGTQLMLTAAGYESDFQRPDFTPEIAMVEGRVGSDELVVTFRAGQGSVGIFANEDLTGALEPEDFWLFDINNDNPRTITSVSHTAGAYTATIRMSVPLSSDDLFNDILAARPASVWDWYEGGYNNPATGVIPAQAVSAGPWPVTISACSVGATSFEFNEPAGSPTVADEQGNMIGVVNDPAQSLLGNGYFTGDGLDNYIDFENNDACLKTTTSLTIEMRINPTGLEGTDNYIRRVFARDSGGNYQASVWRNNGWATYNAPTDTASIAFWVRLVDNHGGTNWKPVLTDYDACPIVSDHWYQVRIVWNSAKTGGIPGDIYVDDQGTDGSDTGENWPGYVNCTDADQSQLPPERYLQEGDEITPNNGDFVIGANVNNHANNVFDGLIDWISFDKGAPMQPLSLPPIGRLRQILYLPVIIKGAGQ